MTPAELFAAATGHHRAGRFADAEAGYRALLAQAPGHPDASQLLALVLAATNRPAEALPLAEAAVAAGPRRGDWLSNLGELYRQLGRPADAEAALRRAVAAAPQLPEAHYNLANVLKAAGRHGDAIAAYGEALRRRPNYHQAHFNLANALREEGRLASAVRHYREALALRPDWADAHLNLANALVDQKDHAAAADHYRRAAAGKPDDADLIDSLAHVYAAQGQYADATDSYRRALALTPGDALRELRLAGVGPAVTPDAAAADADRAKLHAALDRLTGRRFDVTKLHSSGAEPPMRLAYHGRDDLALMRRWAEVVAAGLPPAEPPPANDGKPRVGVVVTRGHEGVYARCLGELVARLDPAALDVRVVCGRSGANVLRHLMPAARLETFIVPERVDEAAAVLRAARFDVLHFWEVGTDSLNYFLPFFRPARVVAATWGWPVSSGQTGVDDFVSAAALEPPGAEGHYSERLLRLAALPTYYLRPPVPPTPRREDCGLDPAAHVYLCQQNLRKLQPQFDATLADILRADPAGVVVLIADEQPRVTELLRERLTTAAPDVAGRVVVAPRREREAYLGLVACANVVLDPTCYGGGANTVYDAAAAGAPTVTLPGRLQRTRWAAAVNDRLGVAAELNAADAGDYVRRAVRGATDRDLRADVVRRIRDAAGALFEDAAAVRELQAYFLAAAARARAPS